MVMGIIWHIMVHITQLEAINIAIYNFQIFLLIILNQNGQIMIILIIDPNGQNQKKIMTQFKLGIQS